ncbi:hypothetical protein I317_07375 [Kwoniella heveanensis CBS 569]|nr:hypothetical protein I317_07375 [Kwoniella heveanensis CBS 569]
MARPATSSLFRPLACAIRAPAAPGGPLQTRSLLNAASRSGVNTASIDNRVLEGVNGFLPKGNFDRLQEWQLGLWERLQGEVQNNPALVETKQKWDRYGLDMTDLISTTARDKNLTLAYNYAALLLNNSFFLEGLSAETPRDVPSEFKVLQEKVEAYSEGLVGGGWLWIVRTGQSKYDLDVIPTFASGTLLVTLRSQRGRESTLPLFAEPPTSGTTEAPTTDSSSSSDAAVSSETSAESTLAERPSNRRASSTFSKDAIKYPTPLAVLNLFEHAYIGEKYGVWGKREYARDWWKNLDWNKVAKRNSTSS